MKKVLQILLLLLCVFAYVSSSAQVEFEPKVSEVWDPEPKIVTPGDGTAPPSDAIVLFDGSDFSEWTHSKGEAVGWKLDGDAMVVTKRTGGIMTKKEFGDCQLHIEWRTPSEVVGEGQGRGNSGVFLQSRYEVQVLDSYGNRTYSNGQAGSIYKQAIPLVNASRKPGAWQTYDIIYTAPRFNADGMRTAAGRVTVIHNGVLIQNNVEIRGTTEYRRLPQNIAHGKAPIMLQDHGNPVSYRNIWVRAL